MFQQPSLPGKDASSRNVDCVDTDSGVHSSPLFPLLLLFPSFVFGSEIFQDFSHHLGNSEMEILSKMCSLVFMLCKSENKKSLKLNLGWSGMGWSGAHARKPPTALLQKEGDSPCASGDSPLRLGRQPPAPRAWGGSLWGDWKK